MRAREFIQENASAGATSAGSVASVSQAMGSMISRAFAKPAKYANSLISVKKRKRNAS